MKTSIDRGDHGPRNKLGDAWNAWIARSQRSGDPFDNDVRAVLHALFIATGDDNEVGVAALARVARDMIAAAEHPMIPTTVAAVTERLSELGASIEKHVEASDY